MRILFISHSSGDGGAEVSALNVIEHLTNLGHKVTCMIPQDSGLLAEKLRAAGLPFIISNFPWAMPSPSHLIYLALRDNAIETLSKHPLLQNIDIIFSNTIAIFHGALLAQELGVAHIQYSHEIVDESIWYHKPSGVTSNGYLQLIGAMADAILCCSHTVLERVREATQHHNLYFLPPYLRKQKSSVSREPREVARGNRLNLLVIGFIQDRKNQEFSLACLKAIRLRGTDAHIHFIGQDAGGGAHLRRSIEALSLTEYVSFHGRVEDPYIVAAGEVRVNLICAIAEPFGLTAVEALKRGVPTICPESAGAAEFLPAGWRYPAAQLDACVRAIERVLSDYPAAVDACRTIDLINPNPFTADFQKSILKESLAAALASHKTMAGRRSDFFAWLKRATAAIRLDHLPDAQIRRIVCAELSISEKIFDALAQEETQNPGASVLADARTFDVVPFSDSQQMARLYREGRGFVFELLTTVRNPSRELWSAFIIGRLYELRSRLGRDPHVLFYGDGLGLETMRVAACGWHAYYADVDQSLTGRVGKAFLHYTTEFFADGSSYGSIQLYQAPSRQIFDAVVCLEVIEHVDDPRAFLCHLRDCLSEQGELFISESFACIANRYATHLWDNRKLSGRMAYLAAACQLKIIDFNYVHFGRPYVLRRLGDGESIDWMLNPLIENIFARESDPTWFSEPELEGRVTPSATLQPLPPPAPWLPPGRWLPAEKTWADETLAEWGHADAETPRVALALLPHPTLAVQPTADSLETQWLGGRLLPVQAQPDIAALVARANRELLDCGAGWLGLIDTGDRLAPDALFRVAQGIRNHPEWQLVYTDEDNVTPEGQHANPHCKPDFNLDYLRSLPYVGGLLLIRRDLFEALGGFDPDAEGAEDYDLLLRAWERLQSTGAGDAAIGHIPEVLYHRLVGSGHTRKSVPEILAAGQAALQRHFDRLGIAAKVEPGPFPPAFRTRWPLPETRPLVSIIVPTRNQLGMLQRCVESVIEKTRYPAYEILIVDNGSDDADTCRYLDAIQAREAELAGRLRVIRHPGAFNFSAMNNAAAATARGDYLLLLNNDTAALHDDWLDEMMGHAVRPDVGIVGAKLLYPDGKIQHAGVILGIRGPAEHPFIGRPPEDRGYFGRAQLVQDLSAVTGACLLVRRSVFEQVGGLDATAFKVSYNDIDLCLKVRKAGYRVVFTPFALVMHEGSASQKGQVETQASAAKLARFAAERDAMYSRWLPQIAFDPAYNRHLSLASTDYLLEDQPPLSWDPDWRPRPRILVHSADREGCGEYRIIAPMRALNRAGLTQGWETMRIYEPAEMERMRPDSLVVQRQMEWPQIEALERHVKHSKAFRVFEIDDLITNLPLKSVHKKSIHKDIAKRFRKAAGLCNRLVVATEPLAQAYAGFSDEVMVQPNYLEAARWGSLRPARAGRDRMRVGWAGGIGHTGDLELIVDVVRDTADEVDWVFFGLCPEALKPLVREFHPGVPLDQYPAKLASLDLDLAVAPLEDNAFNEAKSHLRLLEYGVLGYPVICSDLTPYQGDFPVTRVANRYRDWMRAIRDAVADPAALRATGDALRAKVLAEWMMEDHLDTWLRAWLP